MGRIGVKLGNVVGAEESRASEGKLLRGLYSE